MVCPTLFCNCVAGGLRNYCEISLVKVSMIIFAFIVITCFYLYISKKAKANKKEEVRR